eukprot:g1456.t1
MEVANPVVAAVPSVMNVPIVHHYYNDDGDDDDEMMIKREQHQQHEEPVRYGISAEMMGTASAPSPGTAKTAFREAENQRGKVGKQSLILGQELSPDTAEKKAQDGQKKRKAASHLDAKEYASMDSRLDETFGEISQDLSKRLKTATTETARTAPDDVLGTDAARMELTMETLMKSNVERPPQRRKGYQTASKIVKDIFSVVDSLIISLEESSQEGESHEKEASKFVWQQSRKLGTYLHYTLHLSSKLGGARNIAVSSLLGPEGATGFVASSEGEAAFLINGGMKKGDRLLAIDGASVPLHMQEKEINAMIETRGASEAGITLSFGRKVKKWVDLILKSSIPQQKLKSKVNLTRRYERKTNARASALAAFLCLSDVISSVVRNCSEEEMEEEEVEEKKNDNANEVWNEAMARNAHFHYTVSHFGDKPLGLILSQTEYFGTNNFPHIFVDAVAPGSSLQERTIAITDGGIQSGDTLLAIDGKPFRRKIGDFKSMLLSAKSEGRRILLTFGRFVSRMKDIVPSGTVISSLAAREAKREARALREAREAQRMQAARETKKALKEEREKSRSLKESNMKLRLQLAERLRQAEEVSSKMETLERRDAELRRQLQASLIKAGELKRANALAAKRYEAQLQQFRSRMRGFNSQVLNNISEDASKAAAKPLENAGLKADLDRSKAQVDLLQQQITAHRAKDERLRSILPKKFLKAIYKRILSEMTFPKALLATYKTEISKHEISFVVEGFPMYCFRAIFEAVGKSVGASASKGDGKVVKLLSITDLKAIFRRDFLVETAVAQPSLVRFESRLVVNPADNVAMCIKYSPQTQTLRILAAFELARGRSIAAAMGGNIRM